MRTMFYGLVIIAISLSVFPYSDGAATASFLPTAKLACPKGGYITREKYCEKTPGCANGEDNDTIYPRGPCIKVRDNPLDYRFSCGSKGGVVPLVAMCNGSVECANGKDETHAFCTVAQKRVRGTEGVCPPVCPCEEGVCTCSNGFSSGVCDVAPPDCEPGCEAFYDCINGQCTCDNPEAFGDNCEYLRLNMDSCNSPCLNGGTCVIPAADHASRICLCRTGWTGTMCEEAVCSSECQNGGTCADPNSCECVSGWGGDHCQTPVCSPVCQNGGSCTDPNTCECDAGWTGDHCETLSNGAGGDPHFLVNLRDNSNLCFSLQGEPGFAFNLVTSEIIVINAVFIDAPPRLQDWTTVIGEIGVLYRTMSRSVLKIHFNFKDKSIYVSGYGVLDAKRVSSVVLKGEQLEVRSSNITHTWASTVFVSIGDELKFKVFFNHDNLDIVWSDVSSFNHSSHGILGQFFNKGTKIDKEKRHLVLPERSPIPVILEDPKPEVHHKSQCWRPQTPGYQGEGLLEGDYSEYVMDSVFATDFKYSMTSL